MGGKRLGPSAHTRSRSKRRAEEDAEDAPPAKRARGSPTPRVAAPAKEATKVRDGGKEDIGVELCVKRQGQLQDKGVPTPKGPSQASTDASTARKSISHRSVVGVVPVKLPFGCAPVFDKRVERVNMDVWTMMLSCEVAYMPVDYMRTQINLNPKMRAVLFDWMIEVCDEYALHRETLYLSLNYVDRFLSAGSTVVEKGNLQLVGVTALFLAAKLEEIYPPKVQSFANVTDGAYSVALIHDMEWNILQTLNWNMCAITTNQWTSLYLEQLQRFLYQDTFNGAVIKGLEPDNFPIELYKGAMGLADMCAMDYSLITCLPSVVAAACLMAVYQDAEMVERVTGYSQATLEEPLKVASLHSAVPSIAHLDGEMLRSTKSILSYQNYVEIEDEDKHNIQLHNPDSLRHLLVCERSRRRASKAKAKASANPVPATTKKTVKTTKKTAKKSGAKAKDGAGRAPAGPLMSRADRPGVPIVAMCPLTPSLEAPPEDLSSFIFR